MTGKTKKAIIYTSLLAAIVVVYGILAQEIYYFDENMAKLEQKYQQEIEEIITKALEKAEGYERERYKGTGSNGPDDPNCWGCPQPAK